MNQEAQTFDPILRWPQVQNIVGVHKNTIRRMMKAGTFPSPLKLSPDGRACGWLLSDIEQWQKSLVSTRTLKTSGE